MQQSRGVSWGRGLSDEPTTHSVCERAISRFEKRVYTKDTRNRNIVNTKDYFLNFNATLSDIQSYYVTTQMGDQHFKVVRLKDDALLRWKSNELAHRKLCGE